MKRWMMGLLAALLLTGCGSRKEAPMEGTGRIEKAVICQSPAQLRPGAGWVPGDNLVVFGQYQGNPITWRVLPSSQNPECLLLDCEASLWLQAFDSDFRRNDGQAKSPNEWAGSDLEVLLNGEFWETSFTEAEQSAIALTTLEGEDTPYSASDWAFKFTDFPAEDRIFLLSALEAKTLYGDNQARVKSGVSPNWWLRSKFDKGGNGAASIHIDGHICSNSIQNFGVGVSPALNIRIPHILFASEIQPNTWKLTLLDESLTVKLRKSAKRSETGEITLFYRTEGENINRIAVVLTDDDHVLWAGTLKPIRNGTGSFTLPEPLREKICGKDYRAWLLPIHTDGETQTDRAGTPVEIAIP